MASTNAERQRRYRERRIKTGERVRLEFRVTRRQAEDFKALAARWDTSKTDAFLRLCRAAETSAAPERGAGRPPDVESAYTFPTPPPSSREDLLQRVDRSFLDVGNWIAWSAADFDDEDKKEVVYRLSSEVDKLARRIQRRYPGN